jgi:hypothetical protein
MKNWVIKTPTTQRLKTPTKDKVSLQLQTVGFASVYTYVVKSETLAKNSEPKPTKILSITLQKSPKSCKFIIAENCVIIRVYPNSIMAQPHTCNNNMYRSYNDALRSNVKTEATILYRLNAREPRTCFASRLRQECVL